MFDMQNESPKIHVLSQAVANRIAAGEVVERPASVVRELLDNSIDAGATRIDIEVENGGSSLIKITDNGYGMSAKDAQLCTQRHATSKIKSFEDLEKIGTKGFRGEALAAISSVSKFSLKTRREHDEFAVMIETVNGVLSPPQQAGGAYGTSITIKDLFYNTPARKKFMKKPSTEQGHILNTVTGLALAHETIHFTLMHNGKRVIDCPSVQNRPERIRQLFGNDILNDLIPVSLDTPVLSLSGLISRPTLSRNNAQHMHFFVNNRLVKDRLMHSASMNGYRNLIHSGRYPVLFLYYEIDPKEIDVNVHPTKQEIKFSHEDAIFSTTYGAIRQAWDTREEAKKDIQQHLQGMNKPNPHSAEQKPEFSKPIPPMLPHELKTPSPFSTTLPMSKPKEPFPIHQPIQSSQSTQTAVIENKTEIPLTVHQTIEHLNRTPIQPVQQTEAVISQHQQVAPSTNGNGLHDLQSKETGSSQFVIESLEETGELKVVGQLMNSYILAESKDGLLIIDQHAAHERVMFERFFTRAENAPLESQMMLFPITIDFSPKEAETLGENIALFTQLGFEVEPFGPKTYVFRAIPTSLNMNNVEEAIHDILGELLKDGSAKETRDRALHTMACRASVKFGDPLSMDEMKALIRELEKMPRRNVCPHGRPNILALTDDAMRKAFKRTGF
jgi:DNA mismatch repair protein MutL